MPEAGGGAGPGAGAAGRPGGGLPRTGEEIARSLAVALVAIATGFGLRAIDRRVRRRRARPS
ncbi:MAG TPA: hypothetical protein VFB94_26040 [Acidimicrobiales bacterium]|nr:hypothetical protein [Acidimicrobiales bacterium]